MTTRRLGTLFALLALVVGLTACGSSSKGSSASSASSSSTTSSPGGSGGGSTITIKDFSFSPDALTVKAGTTVTIRNADSVTHTFTTSSGDPASIDTGNITSGSSKQVRFTKPGTYAYHCDIHSSMKGTVTVTS